MRAIVAILVAVLSVGFGGPASAASAAPPRVVAIFDIHEWGDDTVIGRATINVTEPTERDLSAGYFRFVFAPGGPARYSESLIYRTGFWYDPEFGGGAKVAAIFGADCYFEAPQWGTCRPFEAMVVDIVDPTAIDEFRWSHQDPNTGEWDGGFTYAVSPVMLNIVLPG